jgi:hypothetical protein
VLLAHLLRPLFAAGELTPLPEGIVVNIKGIVMNLGTWL